jgi:hypothetical protein
MTKDIATAFTMGVAIGGGAEQPLVALLMKQHCISDAEMNKAYEEVFVPLVEKGLIRDTRS